MDNPRSGGTPPSTRYSRRDFLTRLSAYGAAATAGGSLAPFLGNRATTAQASAPLYLVLIVLDGFRPDYASLAPMPALTSLMQRGTTYDSAWVGQLESITPASHATLSTAVFPNRHGLIGFEWRDRQNRNTVIDGWDQNRQSSPILADLRSNGRMSLAAAAKAADPHARIVSISSEKVYAADAIGGPSADYIFSYDATNSGFLQVRSGGNTPLPSGLAQSAAMRVSLPLKHFSDWDYWSAQLAIESIRAVRPTMLFLNLPGADVYGHLYGGIVAPAIMTRIVAGLDRNIARVISATKDAGTYDQTLFVVVADHGMSPNLHVVRPASVKRTLGRADAPQMFHTGGTASYIYLKDAGKAAAVSEGMAHLQHVVTSYHQTETGGQYQYVPVGGASVPPALDAAYRYLLGTIAGATAPDVAAPFHENTIGKVMDTAYGHHGGLNWGVQHVPLVFAGPGIQPGSVSHFPARLVDVGATVAHVLGLSIPDTDGVVLADSLTSTSSEIAAQTSAGTALVNHQNALRDAYDADIASDRAKGLHRRPLRPIQP